MIPRTLVKEVDKETVCVRACVRVGGCPFYYGRACVYKPKRDDRGRPGGQRSRIYFSMTVLSKLGSYDAIAVYPSLDTSLTQNSVLPPPPAPSSPPSPPYSSLVYLPVNARGQTCYIVIVALHLPHAPIEVVFISSINFDEKGFG